MGTSDEHIDIDAEDVKITGRTIVVNSGWSPKMAYWNTVGTLSGALVGLASLILSLVALSKAFGWI